MWAFVTLLWIGAAVADSEEEPRNSASSSQAEAKVAAEEPNAPLRTDADHSSATDAPPPPTTLPPTTLPPTTTTEAATTTSTTTSTTTTTTTTEPPRPRPIDEVGADGLEANPGELYPQRLGIEDNDHESLVGSEGGTAYSGWNVYIDTAAASGGVLTFEGRVFNRSDSSQSFSSFEWGLQHPSGEIRGSLLLPTDASGSVASGGTAPLTIVYNVEERSSGEWVYLINDPLDYTDDARGIWGFQIP